MDPVSSRVFNRLGRLCLFSTATALLGGCVGTPPPLAATRNQIIISVRDQKLTVVKEDHTRVSFPISTSKFGLGDRNRSYETPTGELAVAAKIGGGAPAGAVFHGRVTTGEVVKVDAPGRDAIVSRILALRGLEAGNAKAFSRGIYIHGTPEERNIGRPTSYGCIRMRSRDVIALYDMVKVGARVQIIDTTQNSAIAANIIQEPAPAVPASVTAATGATVNITNSAAQTVAKNNVPVPATATATATPAPANKKADATNTTTIVTPGAQVPPPPAAKPKATASKKDWAGAPSKLLEKANAADAKAKDAKPPVGAPPPAHPVLNNDGDGMTRSALDSL